jgi:hypothetical protein
MAEVRLAGRAFFSLRRSSARSCLSVRFEVGMKTLPLARATRLVRIWKDSLDSRPKLLVPPVCLRHSFCTLRDATCYSADKNKRTSARDHLGSASWSSRPWLLRSPSPMLRMTLFASNVSGCQAPSGTLRCLAYYPPCWRDNPRIAHQVSRLT